MLRAPPLLVSALKGYYTYLCIDSGSQKWSRLPWDLLVKAKEEVITLPIYLVYLWTLCKALKLFQQ